MIGCLNIDEIMPVDGEKEICKKGFIALQISPRAV